jgi:hypothetical protein
MLQPPEAAAGGSRRLRAAGHSRATIPTRPDAGSW